MADLAKIKRNVSKMVSMSAPEADIDAYISSEGVTIDDVRNFSVQPTQQVEMAADVAKSFGSGLAEGAYGMAMLPKTLGELAGKGVTYGIDRLSGMSPEQASAQQAKTQQAMEANTIIPSPFQLLEKGYNAVRPYVSYTPQTIAGQYAKTAGEFAPAAISPGTAAQKIAAVAAPAIASETAGQLTKGKAAEPVARLAGGLIGGRLASPRTTAIKETGKLAPTEAKLARNVSEAYKAIDDAGVSYNPRLFRGEVTNSMSKIREANLDVDPAGESVFKLLDRIRRASADKMTPGYIDKQHSRLGKILSDPTKSGEAKEAALIARQSLMDIIGTQPLRSASGKSGADVVEMTRQARELAASKIKSSNIATREAVGEWYQSGGVSGVRNQLSNLGKSLEKSKNIGWTPMEVDALKDAAKGTVTTNLLNMLGKFGFDFTKLSGQGALLPALGYGGGAAGLGAVGGLVIPAVGTAAKYGAKKATQGSVEALRKVILAGKTGQMKGVTEADRKNAEAFVRQLITSGQSAAVADNRERGSGLVVDVPLQPGLLGGQ